MHLKEQELYEGIFEDHDILKMPEIRVSPQVRLDLNLGVEKYLDASGVHKNARTQKFFLDLNCHCQMLMVRARSNALTPEIPR